MPQEETQAGNAFIDERFLEEAATHPSLSLARVISQYRDLYKVSREGEETLAEVSGKYRHNAAGMEAFPAVGDYVMVRASDADSDRAIIEATLTRKSAFKRSAVGHDDQVQVIAANVDVLFICMALNDDYNINRLERYLSTAWDSGAEPVVVLTKADLCDDVEGIVAEVSAIAFGVTIIVTSLEDESSYSSIRDRIESGTTASFVGSSGVGKSTIVNHLLGSEVLETADIRQDGKGRHTTTNRELFVLENGGAIIDTPGMRELGIESGDLTKSFSDIEELAANCRFNDCSHESEPGCAVKQALEEGLLDERRIESYRKLKKEMGYAGMNSRQIEEAKILSMVGGFGEMKKVRDYGKKKNTRR